MPMPSTQFSAMPTQPGICFQKPRIVSTITGTPATIAASEAKMSS